MCVFAYMSSVIMNLIIWCCSIFSGASCKFLLRKVNETTNTVSHNLHEGTTLGTTATNELITLLKLAMQQNYFKASNECWTQNDRTLIGSLVCSVQAEFFLLILEEYYYPNKRERERESRNIKYVRWLHHHTWREYHNRPRHPPKPQFAH